ncbi:MAG: methylated-DNA--[protein]-cysteine S-methyltransferase [Chloroflexota bacterium]
MTADRAELTALAASAPASLADDVLVELGLVDRLGPLPSPIGTLWVASNGRGVSTVDLGEPGEIAARHEAQVGRRVIVSASLPAALASAVSRRLAGERHVPIALDLRGRTPFEVAVWEKALEIPFGEVRPYGWIAAEIGKPGAVRAVGTALGHNPVPLVVPCHRVVRSDGFIGNYSLGGPHNKRAILTAEGLDPDALEDDARRGVRLVGSDTTKIFCWPTCRHAKRTTPQHKVRFRSMREAAERGYRACKVCRPATAEAA